MPDWRGFSGGAGLKLGKQRQVSAHHGAHTGFTTMHGIHVMAPGPQYEDGRAAS